MTLRKRTFSSVRWTTIAAISGTLLLLAQTAILARLLVPADYGLMAMAGVVLGYAGLFSDLGLNSAYLQRQNVTQEERSSLFWLNLGMGILLSLLLVVLSPLLALLFGDKRLSPILMLCATVFVFNALGQQIRMTAEKELDFRPVALLEISAILIGFATAVILAINGGGVYALVYGSVVASAFSAIMAWILIANGWRPQMRLNLADIRPYLRFGWAVVGGNIVNYSNMSFDLLLGGRLLGVESLGLFSIPRNLILQIQFTVNPIITRVGFPLIAQIQHDIPRVRAVYLKTMKMTVSCNAPIYIGLAFYAPEIVYVLLGKNWISSIDLLRILAIWGLFRSMGNPVGILLLGMGRAGLALKWNLALLVITPPVLWFGSLYGAKGMAIAMAIFTGIMFVPGWYILVRPLCYLKLGDYIGAVFKPTLIALLAISVSFIIAGCCVHPMTRLLVGVVLSVCFYAAVSYVFNRELLDSVSQLILGRDFGLRVLS